MKQKMRRFISRLEIVFMHKNSYAVEGVSNFKPGKFQFLDTCILPAGSIYFGMDYLQYFVVEGDSGVFTEKMTCLPFPVELKGTLTSPAIHTCMSKPSVRTIGEVLKSYKCKCQTRFAKTNLLTLKYLKGIPKLVFP